MVYYTMHISISTPEVVFYHNNVVIFINYPYTHCSILLQNIVFYHKFFLPQCVVFPMNYSTVNCSIVLQNIVVYHKKTIF